MTKINDKNILYWYTLKEVFAELRSRGLPITWAHIKQYQEANLAPQFKNAVIFNKKHSKQGMPIFTQKDVDNLVEAITKIKT